MAEEEHADVVIVGNAGMAGRKKFLLANVPNRISHLARCTVIVVNTAGEIVKTGARMPIIDLPVEEEVEDPLLMSRVGTIAKVAGKHGLQACGLASRTRTKFMHSPVRADCAACSSRAYVLQLGQILVVVLTSWR